MPKGNREHGEVGCVCTICTCGVHHCPPTPMERHSYEPGLASDYASKFKGGSVPVHRQPKPEYVHASKPFEGTTEHKDNFVTLENAQRSNIKPKAGAVTLGYLYGDERKFQPGSMYRDNFTGKPGQKAANYKPADTFLQSGKFDGDTTSRAAFVPNADAKPRAPFKPQSKLNDVKEDRSFETEGSKNFHEKAFSARPSYKPKASMAETAGPFAGVSSNRSDFPEWKGARPATAFAPAPTVRDGAPDDRKFETDNRANFTKKGDARRQPFKQTQHAHTTGQPLNAESTLRAHFPHWKDAKPATPADHAQNIETHKEDRDFATMNRSDFPPKKSDVQRARVHQTIALPKEDRDFATTSASHVPPGNHTRLPFVPVQSLVHTGPFAGKSTAADAFTGAKTERRAPFKPAQSLHATSENRDFATTGRSAYQGAAPEPCESLSLTDRHVKQRRGHKHYEWHHGHQKWNALQHTSGGPPLPMPKRGGGSSVAAAAAK